MAKTQKSQWDFGELFPAEAVRKVLTVSELTSQVRRTLENQLGRIWVTGEITNFRAQNSGHCYFTIKDPFSQLSCVLFRGDPVENRGLLRDGQKVVLQGELTVYEARGQYQLRVTAVELHGLGALQAAFEKLKLRLQAQGWFAPERKRPLPRFPHRIGLVTSPTGAAIRDVLHVIQRRHAGLELILAPCRVQGAGATEEIAAAIHRLNEWSDFAAPTGKLDLILVTRGGGSLEDLWAFNEEIVARAIFESHLPVISAVGHEIDFTISDFVADFRAATPSAAAEILTEGFFASREFVAEAPGVMRQRVRQRLEREARQVQQWNRRLLRQHPRRLLRENSQRLDDLQTELRRMIQLRLRDRRGELRVLAQRLVRLRPSQTLARRGERLAELRRRLRELAHSRREQLKNRSQQAAERLRLLSPLNVLERGYSITTDAATGKIVRAAKEVQPGQRLQTRVKEGEIGSVVEGA